MRMSEKIVKLEGVLRKDIDNSKQIKGAKSEKRVKRLEIPRGTSKSGRTWKSPKKRFSSIIKTRGYKKAHKFEKLQILKEEMKRARQLTKNIVEKKQQEIENKKERRRRNLKKKEENRLKSEVVQVIKNSAKIKRMKKKALRNVEKRDTISKL